MLLKGLLPFVRDQNVVFASFIRGLVVALFTRVRQNLLHLPGADGVEHVEEVGLVELSPLGDVIWEVVTGVDPSAELSVEGLDADLSPGGPCDSAHLLVSEELLLASQHVLGKGDRELVVGRCVSF